MRGSGRGVYTPSLKVRLRCSNSLALYRSRSRRVRTYRSYFISRDVMQSKQLGSLKKGSPNGKNYTSGFFCGKFSEIILNKALFAAT